MTYSSIRKSAAAHEAVARPRFFLERACFSAISAIRHGRASPLANNILAMISYIIRVSLQGVVRVSKWGASLAVRLPKKLVEEMGLADGDDLEITRVDARSIGLRKVDRDAEFLERLRALQEPVPAGFHWSRDEANER
jgi:antitoxin MazE